MTISKEVEQAIITLNSFGYARRTYIESEVEKIREALVTLITNGWWTSEKRSSEKGYTLFHFAKYSNPRIANYVKYKTKSREVTQVYIIDEGIP